MASKVSCGGCLQVIKGKQFLRCYQCKQHYDLDCAGVPEKRFLNTLTGERRDNWKCALCISKQVKASKTDDTPIRVTTGRGAAISSPPELIQQTNDKGQTDLREDVLKGASGAVPKTGLPSSDTSASLAKQTALITQLVIDVAQIKAQNDKIQKTNESIEAFMSFVNSQFESLKDEVESLKKERKEQTLYIQGLEQKLKDLQHASRSSGIEIRNIPHLQQESPESLTDIVTGIGHIIGSNITKSDLRDVHRLPGSHKTPRPIVAEFTTVQAKQKILTAVRNYNKNKKTDAERLNTVKLQLQGPLQAVNVSEQLPSTTKRLLYLAQEFKRNNAFAFCWVANGNIFLRKEEGGRHVLISSEQSLKNLCKEFVNPNEK